MVNKRKSPNYYERTEQETVLIYQPATDEWDAYSCYPKHIRKLIEIAIDVIPEHDENGNVISVQAKMTTDQVRLYTSWQNDYRKLGELVGNDE